MAFTVTREDQLDTPLLGPNDIVWLQDLGGTNSQDRFNAGTDTLTVPSTGIYFMSLCAGFVAKQTALVRTKSIGSNTYEIGLIRASTAHKRDSQCRSGMLFLEEGVSVKLRNDGAMTLSDDQYQTQWSAFSVSDSMLGNTAFAATLTAPFMNGGTVQFNDIYINENNVFRTDLHEYVCRETGIYLFDLSVGLKANQYIRVEIQRSITQPKSFELTRTSTMHNDIDTLGRSVLLNCQKNERVFLKLLNGELYGSSNDIMTSFSGFKYDPCKGVSVAWAAYRNTEWGPKNIADKLDPVTFNIVEVNLGGALVDNRVTIPVGGYYYICVTVGAKRSKLVNVDVYVTKASTGYAEIYADVLR